MRGASDNGRSNRDMSRYIGARGLPRHRCTGFFIDREG